MSRALCRGAARLVQLDADEPLLLVVSAETRKKLARGLRKEERDSYVSCGRVRVRFVRVKRARARVRVVSSRMSSARSYLSLARIFNQRKFERKIRAVRFCRAFPPTCPNENGQRETLELVRIRGPYRKVERKRERGRQTDGEGKGSPCH